MEIPNIYQFYGYTKSKLQWMKDFCLHYPLSSILIFYARKEKFWNTIFLMKTAHTEEDKETQISKIRIMFQANG